MNKNLSKEDQVLQYLEHLDIKTESIMTQLEIINKYLYKLTSKKEDSLYSDEDYFEKLPPIGSTGLIGEGGSTK